MNYITQLAVPEYIMGVIRANSRYHLLYLALCAALLVLLISRVLVLPLFLLEHKSLWQSVRESVGYVRTRILRTFLLLLRWNVSALLRSLLLVLFCLHACFFLFFFFIKRRHPQYPPPFFFAASDGCKKKKTIR